MDRQEALRLVKEQVKTQNLIKHMLAAEAIMLKLAQNFNEDPEVWSLAGLVHDLDCDLTCNNPEEHALISADILAENGADQRIIHAVKGHADKAPRISLLDKALYATDPLTGFLVACALIHPSKKLSAIDVEFAKNRFKEKHFAKGANREQLATCTALGLSLDEFFSIGLKALQGISGELGL